MKKVDGCVVDLSSILNGDESSTYEKLYARFLQNRIIIFNQPVDIPVIDDVVAWIIQWNLEDMCLAKKDRKPITIFIHSLGGDMYEAGPMIDIIQTSETPIRVIGLGMIASAAYLIYLAANERYAFSNSIFLQHDGEIDLSNSSGKAKDTMAFFDGMNERTRQYVLDRTNMDEAIYDKNENRELYMYADKAQEYGIVHKIIGKDISLKAIFKG
jgi:ATP-dependent Clp protease protease subunit